jgi:hypothetical protein
LADESLVALILAAFEAGARQEAEKQGKVAGRKTVRAVAEVIPKVIAKRKRKASAYSIKYGRAFKEVAPRYKTKSGSWKKNGFKNAQKAAHKKAKTMK